MLFESTKEMLGEIRLENQKEYLFLFFVSAPFVSLHQARFLKNPYYVKTLIKHTMSGGKCYMVIDTQYMLCHINP